MSYDNLSKMHADEVTLVAPASKLYVIAQALAGPDLGRRASRVDYVPTRAQNSTGPATIWPG